MRIFNVLFISFLSLILIASCNSGNKNSASEAGDEFADVLGVVAGPVAGAIMEEEWISLFDGETCTGWRLYGSEEFPKEAWEIVDGSLHCIGTTKDFDRASNYTIITNEKFGDFELELEWKISQAGNSGVFYFVQEVPGLEIYWSAPEMQVLDNLGHSDNQNPTHISGSLYDMIAADPNAVKPVGEWNLAKIIHNKAHVEHWLNGTKLLEYKVGSEQWVELVTKSKFAPYETFMNPAKEGHIGLQDHTDDVWYRNIRIKKLN